MHTSHRVLGLAVAGIVLATMLAFGAAFVAAQSSPPSQSSHVLIRNLSGDDVDVVAQFVDTDGTTPHSVGFSLPPNGARTIHADDYPELGTSWRGSNVIYSSGPLLSTAILYGDPTAHSIYEGYGGSEGGTELFMPSVHWNALGQWSTIAIQNVDTADAEVEIAYYDRGGNVVAGPFAATIPVGASEIRSSETDCAGGICGDPPVGSLRVTSTNGKKLGAVVQENVHDGTYAYKSFDLSGADTKFLLPSVHRNPGGQFSHILVQNTSEVLSATATITYTKQDGTVADVFSHEIAPAGSWTFHTDGFEPSEDPTNLGNVGSAVVTSDGPDIFVTVIETVADRPYCYRGYNSTAGSTNLLLPSVHHNPLGQYSHVLVQNTSSTSSTDVTIEYYNQDGTLADSFTRTLNANGSYTFHTTSDVPSEEPTNLGNVGTALVTSDSTNIVGIVIETIHMIPAAYEASEQ